jgi:hypothetical protein
MKKYVTKCVEATNKQLIPMVSNARQIDFNTFAQKVDMTELELLFPHYNWNGDKSQGIRLKDDQYVSYWESRFMGIPCVYIEHSCIEYIFC